MDSTRRKDQRRARSALRILLHYPTVSKSVDQFKRIRLDGTDYIWNDRTKNIIATIFKRTDTILIRYRATSYYAGILTSYCDWLNAQDRPVVAVASTNVGRWQRTVARKAEGMSRVERDVAVESLRQNSGHDNWRDKLGEVPPPSQSIAENMRATQQSMLEELSTSFSTIYPITLGDVFLNRLELNDAPPTNFRARPLTNGGDRTRRRANDIGNQGYLYTSGGSTADPGAAQD